MYIIIPMDMTAVNVRGTIVDAMYMLRFTVELRFCILQGRSLYRDAWPWISAAKLPIFHQLPKEKFILPGAAVIAHSRAHVHTTS